MRAIVIAVGALVLLATRGVYGDHLPPVTPVLPGQDHRHENHSGADFSFHNLSDVNFSEGNFTGTLFEDARLDRVLSGRRLIGQFFTRTLQTGQISRGRRW